MEVQKKIYKRKPGRKPVVDKAEKVVKIKLTESEYENFLQRFEKSKLKTKTDFIKHLIFEKEIKVGIIDKNTTDFYNTLVEYYNQYRSIGNNYNQIVKHLKSNFSEQRAHLLINMQVGYVKKLIQITEEVGVLINYFNRWLQK